MHQLRGIATQLNKSSVKVKIGYIGGGSRSWATTLMNDLAQCEDIVGEVALYDVDYESADQNAKLGQQIQNQEDAADNWEYEAVRSIEKALSGADFVICSTQDLPSETMAKDLELPQEYGIYQTVGDTVGPGGTIRAMRAIPQYRKIAAAVREYCPDAWVINYTNPMAICTRTLYAEYPDINAIGLCHEIFKIQELFANLVEKHLDIENVSNKEINVNVKGINHFTWIDEAYYRDENVYDLINEWVANRDSVPRFKPGDLDDASFFVNHRDVTQDLYEQFNLLPAAGDRHLVEFVPWYLNISKPEEIQRWGIRTTPSEYRINHWSKGKDKRREQVEGNEPFELYESGEEVVDWIRALLGIEPLKTHANMPNTGQCPDLPEDAVVETNVLVTGDSVKPLSAGTLHDQVRNIVRSHITIQETLIEAGFADDLDLAFQAFLNDPLVTIDTVEAQELFSRLVETQHEYFTEWDCSASTIIEDTPSPDATD